VKDYRWRAAGRKPQQTSTWWARGELNHSTAASYLGLYAKLQVSAVVRGHRRPFCAVLCRTVMPRGITRPGQDRRSTRRSNVASSHLSIGCKGTLYAEAFPCPRFSRGTATFAVDVRTECLRRLNRRALRISAMSTNTASLRVATIHS